jgi:integrase
MRRFSLHRRKGTYYAQLWNEETGHYLTARCTGATSKNDAYLVVNRWLTEGWPTGRQAEPRPVAEAITVDTILSQLRSAPLTAEDAGRILAVLKERELIEGGIVKAGPGGELFTAFLMRFWTYESSPYVRDKLAHGQRIGKRHCCEAAGHVRTHWAPCFEGRRLATIRRADLRDFGVRLSGTLAAKSVNNIMQVGTVALRWAAENELIPADPTQGVRRFSGETKARGILTPDEAAALFCVAWSDPRARVGNLLAMTTGLRAGEVLALQVRDIGDDRIHVRHSWSERDGLKGTKTNTERTVPLLPAVREELLALVAANPHGAAEDRFLFYCVDPARPMRIETLLDGLRLALLRMSLTETELRDRAKVRETLAAWRSRNIVFHSWRHFASTHMANEVGERAMAVTGHRTRSVFEAYAAHATEAQFEQVAAAAGRAFGNIVPFRKAAAS